MLLHFDVAAMRCHCMLQFPLRPFYRSSTSAARNMATSAFWDSCYGKDGLAYGYDPNTFLRESLTRYLPSGPTPMSALCLAEGQGRNALYITKQYNAQKVQVVAVDYSEVGVNTTNDLAQKESVSDRMVAYVGDLDTYDLLTHCPNESTGYDLIISIFAHTPSTIRKKVHASLAKSLAPGGYFILQAYTPQNIGRGTGGPQGPDFCMSKEGLQSEIQGLEVLELEEKETHVDEGEMHKGLAAVVQGVWRKAM